MLSQQVTTRSAPMEEVERMNAVVVRGSGQEMRAPLRRDPYIIEVDRRRNCYACREFRHMAHHCKNQGRERVADERRLKYGGGRIEGNHVYENNLKEEKNLESLN